MVGILYPHTPIPTRWTFSMERVLEVWPNSRAGGHRWGRNEVEEIQGGWWLSKLVYHLWCSRGSRWQPHTHVPGARGMVGRKWQVHRRKAELSDIFPDTCASHWPGPRSASLVESEAGKWSVPADVNKHQVSPVRQKRGRGLVCPSH